MFYLLRIQRGPVPQYHEKTVLPLKDGIPRYESRAREWQRRVYDYDRVQPREHPCAHAPASNEEACYEQVQPYDGPGQEHQQNHRHRGVLWTKAKPVPLCFCLCGARPQHPPMPPASRWHTCPGTCRIMWANQPVPTDMKRCPCCKLIPPSKEQNTIVVP